MMLLSAHTKSLIDKAVNNEAHAWLFSGPEGAGKGYVARYFASRKLGLENTQDISKHPYFRLISPDHNSISIEQIRALQQFLLLKTPGTASVRRVVILEDAHHMTHEAQNALLKALEEPPSDTIVILTAPRTLQLRETIYSRVQQLPVLTITKTQALAELSGQFEESQIEKAYAMSGGLAGLLTSLLQNEDHALLNQIRTAKELLSGNTFQRLLQVDELSKQKDQLPAFLQACKLICSTALHQATQKADKQHATQWHKRLTAVYEAEAALTHNPSPKLLLSDLFLRM
jgi:DNA polymerase III subunit delta'